MIKFPTICNTTFYMPTCIIRPEGFKYLLIVNDDNDSDVDDNIPPSICGIAIVGKTILNQS